MIKEHSQFRKSRTQFLHIEKNVYLQKTKK